MVFTVTFYMDQYSNMTLKMIEELWALTVKKKVKCYESKKFDCTVSLYNFNYS